MCVQLHYPSGWVSWGTDFVLIMAVSSEYNRAPGIDFTQSVLAGVVIKKELDDCCGTETNGSTHSPL